MKTRNDFPEYDSVAPVGNIRCYLDRNGYFTLDADFGGYDYVELGYDEEYHEFYVEDPYIGSVISTPDLSVAIDELCRFYDLSPEDCDYIDKCVTELTSSSRIDSSTSITSSTDSGFGEDFDVFMLMGYYADTSPDTTGMDGDDFWCYGKFFAKDLATAKRELEQIKNKYPWLKSENMSSRHYHRDIYVDNYNEYFDSPTREIEDDYGNPMDVDNNVFENLEALIEYEGMNNENWWRTGYSDFDDEPDGLPFEL